jgi:hypothetical protein
MGQGFYEKHSVGEDFSPHATSEHRILYSASIRGILANFHHLPPNLCPELLNNRNLLQEEKKTQQSKLGVSRY